MIPRKHHLFMLLALTTTVTDLCLFFIMGYQAFPTTLTLLCISLFPPVPTFYIGMLCSLICLQSFLFFSAPFTPLIYLTPIISCAHVAHHRLNHIALLPLGGLALCLLAHILLLEPHMLHSAPCLACTAASFFGIIGSAWIVSLTLRKQGGRGNRRRS